MIDITGLREDKRPQSSTIVHALLDRLEAAEADALEQARLNGMGASREAALMAKLEAAEKERDELRNEIACVKEVEFPRKAQAVADAWKGKCERLEAERDALRARFETMEKQEPVAWLHETRRDSDVVTDAVKHVWGKVAVGSLAAYSIPLYLAPGAQPALIEQDTSVRKAWARFSNELHRSPNAPYPGMSEAFEQHFSQSFTDREWRAESATWAAAWKAAKRHEAQAQPAPSAPEGWLRAIDEALIVAHIGMANADDTYAQAKSKLDTLIGLHADIATDPAVNGGWKLVPTAESRHPGIHKMLNALHAVDNTPGASEWESYAAFLAAAPKAKP